MSVNRKMAEYNKGRLQGLEMAVRILTENGDERGAKLIRDEIRRRNMTPIKLGVTAKELAEALLPIKRIMYEQSQCLTLMVLHDEFGFGKGRCMRFLRRWNLKVDCLAGDLVDWKDMVETVRKELDIDVPTVAMREEGMIA